MRLMSTMDGLSIVNDSPAPPAATTDTYPFLRSSGAPIASAWGRRHQLINNPGIQVACARWCMILEPVMRQQWCELRTMRATSDTANRQCNIRRSSRQRSDALPASVTYDAVHHFHARSGQRGLSAFGGRANNRRHVNYGVTDGSSLCRPQRRYRGQLPGPTMRRRYAAALTDTANEGDAAFTRNLLTHASRRR